jgi:pimeloyl-ACP methyl ester carboxylesterase
VTTQQNGATLSGTCFQPLNDDKSVAVLIISGSGPTDRDGNSPLLPGKSNTLLQLADSLAHYGIASLRYDKRVIGKSKPPPGTSEADMTLNDIAADAGAMYDWLKTEGYKNLFIIGHSEGSLIGLIIAADKNPNGFISVAGAGRKASDILMEQLAEQFTPPLAAELGKALDSLEQGFTVKKINPSFAGLLRPSVQPYMRSWLKQDPKKLIGQLHCPILILQGTNDLR